MKKYKQFLSLALILFFIVGGCDVEFGNSDDDDGGGGGGSDDEVVEGRILDVVPVRSNGVENITVVIDDGNNFNNFSDTTTSGGNFNIEGNFSGTNDIRFLDADDMDAVLAEDIIEVFPGVELELNDISIIDSNVDLGVMEIKFERDVVENNCSNNTGNLRVEVEDGSDEEIIIQISNSTDILRDNDDFPCEDIIEGQEIEIIGELVSSNTINAEVIEVL